MASASKTSEGKPEKRASVRVKPGSIVDVVDLPGAQIRRGMPVEFSESEARRAVAQSGVLEIVSED